MSEKDEATSGLEKSLPAGFRFAGVAAGIKASGKPDVSLIVADKPCVAAGVYTTNQIVAAPVVLSRSRTPRATCRAVITNSGNANACTGQTGMENAETMCKLVADLVGCDAEDVLVMSTGVIGQHLPMSHVQTGIAAAHGELGHTGRDFLSAADAICTTDQFRKTAAQSLTIGEQTIRIAAMCKGAGMIAPNMATMLGLILTDAPLSAEMAQQILDHAVRTTFNCVSVDGHTSTNDTVLLLSSSPIADSKSSSWSDDEQSVFGSAVEQVCLQLAKMLVADGEGAARFFEVHVRGAATQDDAACGARVVAASPLVKTAITGGDPNWGRIVSAAGYAGPRISPEQTSLSICGETVFRNGDPVTIDDAALSQTMKASDEVKLDLVVGDGPGCASFWPVT